MAEIPIEKKSGIPGWIWALLAVLLAALLLWWLLGQTNEDPDLVESNTVAAAPVVAAPGDADGFAVGEAVDLDNVRVTSLAGDMAFNVDANGQNMLVLFDQTPTPGTAQEGEFDVNPGMVMNLDGEVRSASDPLPEGVTIDQMGGADRYIYATGMEVVSRP